MVFPSLMIHVEPGLVSQLSAWAVIGFSFLLHRLKKVALVIGALTVGAFLLISHAHSFAMMPSQSYDSMGPYGTYTQNHMNYYGRPMGNVPPAYFYPQLQYHSLWGPQPYYFNPHPVSPYSPMYNCPFCNQQMAPQFPYPVSHPGGGIS